MYMISSQIIRTLELKNELNSRWDLLEGAFEIKRNNSQLVNDIRKTYLLNGYERTDITKESLSFKWISK